MEDGGRAVVASEPLWTIRVTALTKPWLQSLELVQREWGLVSCRRAVKFCTYLAKVFSVIDLAPSGMTRG